MKDYVSVIIPARNRHHLLLRAINSVRAQVDVECDVIVVDDASEPPVADFLRETSVKDVKVLRNDQRRNAAFCRNRGAEAARFPHLAFLDSDDFWFPLHLKNALANLRGPTIDVLYVSRFGAEQEIRSGNSTVCSDAYGLIFDRIGDPRSSVLVCGKAFFEEVGGFDELLEKYQDWDFALRCAENGVIALGEAKTVFLDTRAEGRMSSRMDVNAARRFLERHSAGMSPAHRARFFAIFLRVAAFAGKESHREAVALFSEYLSLRSFPIKYWPLRFSPTVGRSILKAWMSLKKTSRPSRSYVL